MVAVGGETSTGLRRGAASIGQIVAAAFRGTPLGQVNLGGAQIPPMLSSGHGRRMSSNCGSLPVVTADGTLALSSLAEVVSAPGATQVDRVDGDRAATITGTATGSDLRAPNSRENAATDVRTISNELRRVPDAAPEASRQRFRRLADRPDVDSVRVGRATIHTIVLDGPF